MQKNFQLNHDDDSTTYVNYLLDSELESLKNLIDDLQRSRLSISATEIGSIKDQHVMLLANAGFVDKIRKTLN